MPLRALLYRRPSEPRTIEIVFDRSVYLVQLRRHRQARRYTLRIQATTREVILTIPPRGTLKEAGEFAQKVIGEPVKNTFVAYYLDSGASAEQKEALRKLFTGPSFAGMGPVAEVKEVAINFENLDAFGQVGKQVGCTVGEIARVEVTPIAGGTDQTKPLAVENEAEPGMKLTMLGKTSNSFYRSAGKDYKFEGTSGESHLMALKGGAEK